MHEMPLFNWIMITEKEDFKYLSKNFKLCKRAQQVFTSINDEIINEFGISETYLQKISKEIQVELEYSRQINSGDKSNQLIIDILEEELKSIEVKSGSIYETIPFISKEVGHIDLSKLTVFAYYNYCKFVEKQSNIKKG